MTIISLKTSEMNTFRVNFERMISEAKRKVLVLNVNESVRNIKSGKAKSFKSAKAAFDFLNS